MCPWRETWAGSIGLTREQAPKQSQMSFNLTCIHLSYPWQLQEEVAGAEPVGEACLGAGALEKAPLGGQSMAGDSEAPASVLTSQTWVSKFLKLLVRLGNEAVRPDQL